MVKAYNDALAAHREPINRLNVYPVPDGDTGTNMSLTLGSVFEELEGVDDDLPAVCNAVSHGSLMGARGNSGVILSQVLRGFVGVVATRGLGGRGWRRPCGPPPTPCTRRSCARSRGRSSRSCESRRRPRRVSPPTPG